MSDNPPQQQPQQQPRPPLIKLTKEQLLAGHKTLVQNNMKGSAGQRYTPPSQPPASTDDQRGKGTTFTRSGRAVDRPDKPETAAAEPRENKGKKNGKKPASVVDLEGETADQEVVEEPGKDVPAGSEKVREWVKEQSKSKKKD